MRPSELKEFLDLKVDLYNQPSFIDQDPIQIPHQFSNKEDIEIIDVYSILGKKLELASGDGYHWSSPAYKIITREISGNVLPVLKK